MKRSNRLIAKILTTGILISALSTCAFAGSSSSSKAETPVTEAKYISIPGGYQGKYDDKSVAHQPSDYVDASDVYTYVLEVSTGQTSATVENITIKYITGKRYDGFHYDTEMAIYTQVITPSQGSAIKAGDSVAGITNWDFVTKSELGFAGSRFATYAPLYCDAGNANGFFAALLNGLVPTGTKYKYSNGSFYGKDHNLFKALNKYSSWSTQLTGEYIQEYNNAAKILDGKSTFAPYTTEYIRFKTEEPIAQVLELDFLLSGTGVGDWSINGWKLLRIEEWKQQSQYKATAESNNYGSITHNEVRAFNSSQLSQAMVSNVEIHTFSFLSNRLALALSDYEVISQSDDSQLKENGGGVGSVAFENGLGHVRFINKDLTIVHNGAVHYDVTENLYLENSDTQRIKNTFSFTDSTSQSNYSVSGKYTDKPTTLNFSVNIKDTYGAGIEAFTSVSNDSVILKDMITARIKYENTWGYTEAVTVPVISNAFFEYAVAPNEVDTDIASKKNISGFAQEGDSLLFSVTFPNYKSLESMDLVYENPLDATDVLTIEDVTVYDDHSNGVRSGYYNATLSQGHLSLSIPDKSTLLYKTKERGKTLDSATKTESFTFVEASKAEAVYNNYNNTYLVTLQTADVQGAGTEADVTVQFKYINSKGVETITTEYEISEAAKEFYGYVPAVISAGQTSNKNSLAWWEEKTHYYITSGALYSPFENPVRSKVLNEKINLKTNSAIGKYINQMDSLISNQRNKPETSQTLVVDASYPYHMRQGGTIKFFITAADLSKFTGAVFHIKDSTDMWQLDSISIQSVKEVGSRFYTAVADTNIIPGMSIYTVSDRNVTGDILFSKSDVNLLVRNDDTKEYDMKDSKVSGESTERDYKQYYYNMSYEMASSNLHFDDAAKKYEIRVNVGSNKNNKDDDSCGSNNLFYFQLVFKNGVSSYVLANQQLSADGFRTGTQEVFWISTNEDFGDVIAVNIIPDDVSDDSSKLDKLNIESIDVIKHNNGAIDKKYTVSSIPNDGWINMEYVDNTDAESTTGRYAGEIVQSLPVSSSSYMLSLEFSMTYASYPQRTVKEENKNGALVSVTKAGVQFHGDMTADIVYVNSNKETKRTTVQVVQGFYDYDKLSATGTKTDGDGITSDTEWMFRANTTDRLTFELGDAISITSVTLNGVPDDNVNLQIKEFCVKILKSKSGQLSVNKNNEFQMQYDEDPVVLVNSVTRKLPETFYFAANQKTSYTFVFGENEIPEFESESSLESIVGRTPDSVNDTINLYLYMGENATLPSAADKDLLTTIQYSSASTGKTYVTDVKKYKETYDEKTERYILSAVGLSATNMSLLNDVRITADASYIGALVDSAIIQQVRNGTIIDTYNITLVGTDASSRTGVTMGTAYGSKEMGEGQTVTIQFGKNSAKSKLTEEKYDVAVALRYHSRIGDTEKIYTSPYVFLTDKDVYNLYPYMMATFDFQEYGVKDIVELRIVGMNGLKADISSASIKTYDIEGDGSTSATGYYSINLENAQALSSSAKDFKVTSDNPNSNDAMIKADLVFKTMETSENIDSNGTVPIRAVIHYANANNALVTKEISDIRSFISDGGSFTKGSTATVSLFLKGAKYISYIELEPYDDDANNVASWNLESLGFELSGEKSLASGSVKVDKTLHERTKSEEMTQINLSSIIVELNAKYSVDGIAKEEAVKAGNGEITVKANSSVSVNVSVHNTLPTYNYLYKVEKVVEDSKLIVTNEVAKSDKLLTFTAPNDETTAVSTYVLTFTSQESKTVSSSLTIHVQNNVATKTETEQVKSSTDANSTVNNEAEK